MPDQEHLYASGTFYQFVDTWICAGSDEVIRQPTGDVYAGAAYHNKFDKCIKGISPACASYFSSILGPSTFFVGKKGRIFRYTVDTDDWPTGMQVYGEYKRVKCEIWDTEDPTYAYIYRSNCPHGPWEFVDEFDFPPTHGSPYVWYDTTVSFNIDYYYKVNTREASGNPAHPTGLSNPPDPPQPPNWLTVEDYPNDDGGRTWLNWHWVSPSYTVHRDGLWLVATAGSEYTDTTAVTGQNHTYAVRKRKIYPEQNEYVYSAPITANCTPINNLAPSAPTNLSGEKVGNYVKMRWDEPTNIDIQGYNIYRKLGLGGSYTKVNAVPCPRAFWYDKPIIPRRVYYKVTAVDWGNNESGYSNEIYFDFDQLIDGIQGVSLPINETGITKILPNPITDHGIIYFSLARDGYVKIEMLDASGRIVTNLLSDNLPAGSHTLRLGDKQLERLSSGIYFLKMNTDDFQTIEKIVIRR